MTIGRKSARSVGFSQSAILGWLSIGLLAVCLSVLAGCNSTKGVDNAEDGYGRELGGDYEGWLSANLSEWPPRAGRSLKITAACDIFRPNEEGDGAYTHDWDQIFYRVKSPSSQTDWIQMLRPGPKSQLVIAAKTFAPGRHVLDFLYVSTDGEEHLLTGWKVDVR